MDPYLGQIFMFGGNFAPKNYAFCEGQIMAISQFEGLFAIMGNAYGGDGITSFALPNLKGRIPTGTGNAPDQPTMNRGQMGGAFRATMTISQLPAHQHASTLSVEGNSAENYTPFEGGSIGAAPSSGLMSAQPYAPASANIADPVSLAPAGMSFSSAGSTMQFTHYPPLIVIPYIVVTAGLFPSRN